MSNLSHAEGFFGSCQKSTTTLGLRQRYTPLMTHAHFVTKRTFAKLNLPSICKKVSVVHCLLLYTLAANWTTFNVKTL